jgi:anti-sigma factor RsiW
MRCAEARDKLGAFVDGELHSPLADALTGHLQHCADCRRACARLEKLASLLEATAVPAVPQALAKVVVERTFEQNASRQRPAFPVRLLGPWRALSTPVRIAAAVVLVVGLSAGAAMGRFVGQTTVARFAKNLPSSEDPVAVYNLEYLGGTQEGSIAQAYLTLVSAGNPSGE